MGLDMYMRKRKYLGYEGKKVKVDDKEYDNVNFLIMDFGYWRKANAIHNWLVKNIQDGIDDCNKHYFPKNKIKELLVLCEEVKEHHERAEELLPTQEGFFFGSTEYDEYYFEGIEYTIKVMKQALEEYRKDDDDIDFYYESSW